MAKRVVVNLVESVAEFAGRVDRVAGVIYGVKILGNESRNIPSGISGVTKGTRYRQNALKKAVSLYEGKASDKNHAAANPNNPHDSDPNARFGWFTNVHEKDGCLYGDYHLLLSDPLTPKIFEAAERNPKLFSVSHNARAKGEVVDGWFMVSEIMAVDSIDCVKDGGTNVSLFESRAPMKTTLRAILRESKNPKVQEFAKKSHVVRLLEMDGLGDTVMDAPADEGAEDAVGWKHHLGEMLRSMVLDDSLSAADLKKKINSVVKLLMDGDKAEGDKTIDVEESADADADDKDKDGETKESLRAKLKEHEDHAACVKLCESAGYTAKPADIEMLKKLPTNDDRLRLINMIKNTTQPRSQSQTGVVKESKTTAGEPWALR